jgi:hypothetical protein
MNFEPVYEVVEYFDGPRRGVASFNGARYNFRSRYLDATEYKNDFESVDVFELTPTDNESERWVVLAVGHFRAVVNQPISEAGALRLLEVAWQMVSEKAQQSVQPDRREDAAPG